MIASTDFNGDHAEERTITGVYFDGLTLTLDKPLEYTHYAGEQTYGDETISMRAEVGLLSRNIKYRGEAGERSKKAKKNDTLNPLDGSLDGETETSDKFSAKYGRRASRSKPKTALQTLDGRMEDRTSNQEYLSNLDGERQAR